MKITKQSSLTGIEHTMNIALNNNYMNIIAYQIDNNYTCNFIHINSLGNLEIRSVEMDFSKTYDFLKYSSAIKISNDIDLYQYAKNIEVAV